MKRYIITILILLTSFSSTVFAAQQPSIALSAAESFVSIIDCGDYLTAYSRSSPLLKQLNPQQKWIDEQKLASQLLGKVIDRQLLAVKARDAHPGMPDGCYLIVCYQTVTTDKDRAIEMLLLKEENQKWSVCNYSIR